MLLPLFNAGANEAQSRKRQRRDTPSRSTRRQSRPRSARSPDSLNAGAARWCAVRGRRPRWRYARRPSSCRTALQQRRGELSRSARRAALIVHGAAGGGRRSALAHLQNQVMRCTRCLAAAGLTAAPAALPPACVRIGGRKIRGTANLPPAAPCMKHLTPRKPTTSSTRTATRCSSMSLGDRVFTSASGRARTRRLAGAAGLGSSRSSPT